MSRIYVIPGPGRTVPMPPHEGAPGAMVPATGATVDDADPFVWRCLHDGDLVQTEAPPPPADVPDAPDPQAAPAAPSDKAE